MTTSLITETIDILKETDAIVSGDNPALGEDVDEIRSFWAITPVDGTLEGQTEVEAVYFNCVEGAEETSRRFPSLGRLVEGLGLSEDAAEHAAIYWEGLAENEALSYDNTGRVDIIGRLSALTTESVEELTEKKAEYKTASGFHKASAAAHSSREQKAALAHAKAKTTAKYHAQKAKIAKAAVRQYKRTGPTGVISRAAHAANVVAHKFHAGLRKFHAWRAGSHAATRAHHADWKRHHSLAAGLRKKAYNQSSTARGSTAAGRNAIRKTPKAAAVLKAKAAKAGMKSKAASAPPPAAAPKASPKPAPAAAPKPPPKSAAPKAAPAAPSKAAPVKMSKPAIRPEPPARPPSSGTPKKPVQPSRKKVASSGGSHGTE